MRPGWLREQLDLATREVEQWPRGMRRYAEEHGVIQPREDQAMTIDEKALLMNGRAPYYQRNGVTLYCGDCAEYEIACDLIVTDPPYGQEFKSGKSDLWGAIKGDRADEVAGTVAAIGRSLRGLRRGRHVYIFEKGFDLSSLPLCGFAELIWDKGTIGMGDLTSPWGPQHEKIRFATCEISKANRDKGYGNLSARLRKGSVLRDMRPISGAVKHHPTEKPVDVLRQLIESSSVMGEIVYDPFAGSGSTLIAAALEGRQAVGVEIDERYCEIAAARFEREIPKVAA